MDQVARTAGERFRQPATRRYWCCALILSGLLPVFQSVNGQGQSSRGFPQASEFDVKAAFLLNFTKFIEWPPRSVPPDAPFTICIAGEDPFGQTIDQITEGEKVDGHPVVVRRVSIPATRPCEIIFISRSEKEVSKLLSEVPPGVLTVSDSEDFLRQGGMIALAVENRRVRFDVDVRAASRAGLKISSRLLNVARSVENQVR
jgi:hypothetical protein